MFFPVVLFIVSMSVDEILIMTIHIKAIEEYFLVVVFSVCYALKCGSSLQVGG